MSENGRRRVVITGMGAVTPCGLDAEKTWTSVREGRSGVSTVEGFEGHVRIAAQVKDFEPERYMDHRSVRKTDRFAQFAVAAARMAVEHAGIDIMADAERIGCSIGTGIGGLKTEEVAHRKLFEAGPDRLNPFWVTALIPNMGAAVKGAFGPAAIIEANATIIRADDQDPEEIIWQARKVGYDNLAGELSGGLAAWAAAGQPVATVPLLDPTMVDPAVLRAMAAPVRSQVSPEFIEIFGNALANLRLLFGARTGVPYVFAGSGTLSLEFGAAKDVDEQPGDCCRGVPTIPLVMPEQPGLRILRRSGTSSGIHIGAQFDHYSVGQRQDSGLEELRLADRDRAALEVNVAQVEACKLASPQACAVCQQQHGMKAQRS